MPLLASCLFVMTLAVPLGAQQLRCVETFDGIPIEQYPQLVRGNCTSYVGGAVRNFHEPGHDAYLLGGRGYCSGVPNAYCSNTTEFTVPVGSNAEFDLLPGPTTTLVEAEGFSQRFPSTPRIDVSWTHIVLPPTANHVRLTTFGGFVPPSYILPSSHVLDNIAFDRLGPLKFEFEYDDTHPGVKVLLHKYMPNDVSAPFQGYWSSYQVTTLPPDASPQIRVPGVLKQGQTGHAGTIWARVIDPPDTASYVPQQSLVPNDNRDTAHPKGTLFYYQPGGVAKPEDPNTHVLEMMTNSGGVTGKAEIFLEASHDVGGENYQVEVSLDQNFTCATAGPGGTDICPKSAVFTTWKRVFVESRRTFRQGAFLAATVSSGAPDITVRTFGGVPPPFAPGQLIRLIHGGATPYFDDVYVAHVRTDPATGNLIPPIQPIGSDYKVMLQAGPNHQYEGVPRNAPIQNADAVGVPGPYFDADPALLQAFYADMFVDVQFAQNASFQDFPYFEFPPVGSDIARIVLATRFTEHKEKNVAHIIGAGPIAVRATPTTCSSEFGLTLGSNSYIFVQNIEQSAAGPIPPCVVPFPMWNHSRTGFIQTDTAHEFTHQWEVNHVPGRNGGHCQENGSIPPGIAGDLCLMHDHFPGGIVNWSQMDQGRISFHWLAGGSDSEYTEVRTHGEPVH